MYIKNEFKLNEIEILQKLNIPIEDKEYTIEDTGNIIEKFDEAIQNSLDKKLNLTEESIRLEKIQAKILQLEEKINN